jgi:hypothetical protein
MRQSILLTAIALALGSPVALAVPVTKMAVCYARVNDTGRWIAFNRWEDNQPYVKLQFQGAIPQWVKDLFEEWNKDAYSWEPTEEEIYLWATELGNTENLPTVQQLTKHQKIAIWLRRIARGCPNLKGSADVVGVAIP